MASTQMLTGLQRLASGRLRAFSREFLWIILGNAAAAIGSVVGIRVLTEFLDPHAYGQVALGVTLAMLANQTVMGPLGNGVMRFYAPAVERKDLPSYLAAVRDLVLRATGATCLLIACAVAVL